MPNLGFRPGCSIHVNKTTQLRQLVDSRPASFTLLATVDEGSSRKWVPNRSMAKPLALVVALGPVLDGCVKCCCNGLLDDGEGFGADEATDLEEGESG